MQCFETRGPDTDSSGQPKLRRWDVAVTIGAIRKIRGRLNVDLLEQEGLQRFTGDPVAVVEGLLLLIEGQHDTDQLTDEQKAELIVDHYEAAGEALMSDLAFFFRKLGRRLQANLLETIVQNRSKLQELEAKHEAEMPNLVGNLLEQADREMGQALARVSDPGK